MGHDAWIALVWTPEWCGRSRDGAGLDAWIALVWTPGRKRTRLRRSRTLKRP